jgi:phospholipid/cholesterol/gamma-HCH transport system ATP-binding protein
MYAGQKEWEGNKNEIIFSKNQRLNDFIFASEFLKDARICVCWRKQKISNERDMEALIDEEAPPLVLPPDEEEKDK